MLHASFRSLGSALAWLVLGGTALGSLYLLNGAAFSAWMAGGPPNPYPQGWAMRSQTQLAWAVAIDFGGVAAFRLSRELPVVRKSTVALAVVCGVLAVLPSANRLLQIDRCLDGGGRWSYEGLQCER